MSDVIYKTNNCPSCVTLESQLAQNPIPGLRILNIDVDPTARQYFSLTGSRSAPTAVIDSQVYIGASSILSALRRKYGKP